jgi:hypothetical protein
MIGQYLLNKNESATVAKSEIFSELNKASDRKNTYWYTQRYVLRGIWLMSRPAYRIPVCLVIVNEVSICSFARHFRLGLWDAQFAV